MSPAHPEIRGPVLAGPRRSTVPPDAGIRGPLRGAPRRPGGFSLLELIVVLLLAGLVAALVVPSFSGTLESARLRSGAAEVRAVLTLARTLAASGSRVRAVRFDGEKGEYGIEGEARRYVLPEGIRIESDRDSSGAAREGPFRVRFFPDGSAEETAIVVASSSGGRLRVTVDPLTGIAEAGR